MRVPISVLPTTLPLRPIPNSKSSHHRPGQLHVHDGDVDQIGPREMMDRTPEEELDKGGSGGVLIIEDLPDDFTVGCDTIAFSRPQHFQGFRDIPEGAHLVWVSPSASTSVRHGYWLFTAAGSTTSDPVLIKQWYSSSEVLRDTTHAEAIHKKQRLGEIYQSLFPYQFRAKVSAPLGQGGGTKAKSSLPSSVGDTTLWNELTSAIQPSLLNRITGQPQTTWPVGTEDRLLGEFKPEEARLAPFSSTLVFTIPITPHLFDASLQGAALSRQALDPTEWLLAHLEEKSCSDEDFVGEFQFAFLTGMHLGNDGCLRQWWFYATQIIFRAHRLIKANPLLAQKLIQVTHLQLAYNKEYLETNIIEDFPSEARKLRKTMVVYKKRLLEQLLELNSEEGGDSSSKRLWSEVGSAFEQLEQFLWNSFEWDLRANYVRRGPVMLEDGEMVEVEVSDLEDEDERGEFAPAVVETDADGNPTGLLTL